jgi:hypothetical protein
MLDYAVTGGLLNHNPVAALPMQNVYRAVPRDRALTAAEVQVFLRAVRASNIRRQFKLAFLDAGDLGTEIRVDAGAVEGRSFRQRRMARAGGEFQDRQAAHRLLVEASACAVQEAANTGWQERMGIYQGAQRGRSRSRTMP